MSTRLRPWILANALACAVLAVAARTVDPPELLFLHETDGIAAAEHRERREKLMLQMGPESIGIFFTNPRLTRNDNVEFPHRGDSNFLYLTGFPEPDAVLVLIPDGFDLGGTKVREILFCRPRDPRDEVWHEPRITPTNAERYFLMESARPVSEFAKFLEDFTAASSATKLFTPRLAVPHTNNQGPYADFSRWRSGSGARFEIQRNSDRLLAGMRVIKSPAEIALIRRATDISVQAHIEALRTARPGMREYEIAALVKYIFEKSGCEAPAYPPIVGSGPMSCVLHYTANRRLMQSGDMVCMDAGGEFRGYAADITRSFPVNGRFTSEQRAIYELVLAGQEAGIAACVPGAPFQAADRAARAIILDGLVRLGIAPNRQSAARYFPHGTSHYVGLDVHDPSDGGPLRPNVVLTVEPGVYIPAGSDCDPKWWNIGIRIEDMILVTESGPVNLSAGVPRRVEEIEALMRG